MGGFGSASVASVCAGATRTGFTCDEQLIALTPDQSAPAQNATFVLSLNATGAYAGAVRWPALRRKSYYFAASPGLPQTFPSPPAPA